MVEYSYGKTLLKVDDVSLEYDGRPILKHVSAEIKDIICPEQGDRARSSDFLAPAASVRRSCSASSPD